MIIVYAGVQADEEGRASPRLPSDSEPALLDRLRGLFDSLKPRLVVGALASGGDILIAEAALHEDRELRAFLPFGREEFKASSVSSRGPHWEHRYDVLIDELGANVSTGGLDPSDEGVYLTHNLALLDQAASLAEPGERIWALTIRPPENPEAQSVSDDFARRAVTRGLLSLDLNPLAQRPRGFIAMSYGTKFDPYTRTSYDCDQVFHKVYRPALEHLDVNWTRADLQTDSGLIHVGMIDDLANSRLVIADLSTWNFNVAYELGLRHVFAAQSTVLINPVPREATGMPLPFDVGVLRTVQFPRSLEMTDEEAENAIHRLIPVLREVLTEEQQDSPVHSWFEVSHVRGPYLQRSELTSRLSRELELRNMVKSAVRSSDLPTLLSAAAQLETEPLPEEARSGLRLELGAALIDEGAYERASLLLLQAEPESSSGLHKTWLHKTAMALRRAGEASSDALERKRHWTTAEKLLIQALELGYHDSETYGIYGGFLKRQLTEGGANANRYAAYARFERMADYYQKGFEADPNYYTGVNLVMSLRLAMNSRPANPDMLERFRESIVVSKFLVRLAIAEDPHSFWPLATHAELLLHEALHGGRDLAPAVAAYANASIVAKPEHMRSASHQLDFLKFWGDPPSAIDLMKSSLAGDI